MKFDEKDIITVAKGRVSRAEGNKQYYWIVGAVLVMIAGVYVVRINTVAGWVLVLIGAAGVFYYMNVLSKKQKVVISQLMKEWREEQTAK